MSADTDPTGTSRVHVYKDARRVGLLSRDDAGRHEILDRLDLTVREQAALIRKSLLGE